MPCQFERSREQALRLRLVTTLRLRPGTVRWQSGVEDTIKQ